MVAGPKNASGQFYELFGVAPDALLTVDRDGRIVVVNAQTENLFGYRREELIGQPVEILMPERFRTAYRSHLVKYFNEPRTRSKGSWLELYARQKDGAGIPVEISLSPLKTEEGLWAISAIREITERMQAEKKTQLVHEITRTIAEAKDFNSALEETLRKVCEATGWICGEAWIFNSDRKVLECAPAWYSSVPGQEKFRELSKHFTFARGVGLPGQVWSSKERVYVSDVTEDANFVRKEIAREAGLKSAVGIPILKRSKVVAVVVFFHPATHRYNSQTLTFLSTLVGELGELFRRKQSEHELRARYQQLQTLYSLAKIVNQSLEIKFILRSAMRRVLEIFGFDAARIRLLSEDRKRWCLVVDEGVEGIPEGASQSVPLGINLAVLKAGKPVFFEDIQNDAEYDRLSGEKTARRLGFRGCFMLLIVAKDETVGLMTFLSKRPHRFSSSEVKLVYAIADQVGTAVENARLHERTLLQMKRLRALHEIDLAISSTLNLQTVLDLLLNKVTLFLPNSASTIRLYTKETSELEFVACRNIDEETWKSHKSGLQHGIGVNSIMAKTKDPVMVSSIKKDKRVAHRDFLLGQGLVSFLGIPLIARDEFLGVLGLYTREEHEWSEDEVEFFTMLGGEAAMAVYNAKLHEKVSRSRTELKALSHRLMEAQEAERRHLARELHDEIGQQLTGLLLELKRSGCSIGEEAQLLAEGLLNRVRDLSLDLRPSILDDLGLVPTLLWHFRRYSSQTGVRVDFHHKGVGRRFESDVETAAYRIVQEALTNVARHAGVKRVCVRVRGNRELVCVWVRDRGRGFDTRKNLGVSGGISGMRERTNLLGGRLVLESQVGRGTSILVEIPLEKARRKRRGK